MVLQMHHDAYFKFLALILKTTEITICCELIDNQSRCICDLHSRDI